MIINKINYFDDLAILILSVLFIDSFKHLFESPFSIENFLIGFSGVILVLGILFLKNLNFGDKNG
jgi:hypothetical protein